MLNGEGPLQNELLSRFDRECGVDSPSAAKHAARTVCELLASFEQRSEARRLAEAKSAAEEKARREHEDALERERYLESLASQQDRSWDDIESLIATKQPKNYEQAVQLLVDLRDLSQRKRTVPGFADKLANVQARHSSKPSLRKRLKDAGL